LSPALVWAVAWREVRATYTTAVGWFVVCAWTLLTSVFWLFSVVAYVGTSQDLVHDPYRAAQLQLTTWLFAPFLSNCAVVLVMFAPLLSMRAFTEDLRNKTMDLLLTSPLSTTEIVLGKYAGLLLNLTVLVGVTLVHPLMLTQWASPDPGAIAAGWLGLWLLGAAVLSLGMWMSSFTSSQLAAAGSTFAVALALFVANFGSEDPDGWRDQLAILTHLQDLLRGEVRLSDLVYYLAFSALCVFGTHQRVEGYRWQ
jgi:ABC-2 type transport system permease protein